ncbi:BQ5605_C003g02129 [Microbotryum silenes-dioicae]|uniref:BQ5605_C003g02129 protein n=1 Tax=Microbotryum silenes-dioicae TaxID=796604 RepID=A0A2X0MVD7_9BASI|nr:BQ5605_C003g02129 [Microbotryum silenes-dioicae]
MCLGQGQSAGANRPNMIRQKETPIFELEIRSSEADLASTKCAQLHSLRLFQGF